MPESSFNKRYLYKMLTNIVVLLTGFAYSIIVPRALGAVSFGNFSFITNFFMQVVNFLQLGSQLAFYSKLSQRLQDAKLKIFYFRFSLLVGLATFAGLGVVGLLGLETVLWPGQEWGYLVAGALFAVLMFFSEVLMKVTDAYALTVPAEIVRMGQKIISLAFLVLLFMFGVMNLSTFFLYHFVSFALLLCGWWWVLRKNGVRLLEGGGTLSDLHGYAKEFYGYCSPFVTLGVAALVFEVSDRWFLQKFGGAAQQGFFSLSYQIASICFLFSGAMTPLIFREFSIAHGEKDEERMAGMFMKYFPMLYAIAAYFSCFVASQADHIIVMTGGGGYSGASIAVFIMAFYPIHQTYGQLSGSVLFARGQTRLYRNITMVMMAVGFPISYLLIAPRDLMGLDAGSGGLALKMILSQIVSVNAVNWFICRDLRLSFSRLLWHQAYSVAIFYALAVVVRAIVEGAGLGLIPAFLLSGMVYTALVVIVGYGIPSLFTLSREQMNRLMALALKPLTVRWEGGR